MNRENYETCWYLYEEAGSCECSEFEEETNEILMEDVEGFLTNQELQKLAKEAGIDPDDFLWELDWPKLRRFAYLVEKVACSKASTIVHCENCGCDWVDNGLNPIGCPYCK